MLDAIICFLIVFHCVACVIKATQPLIVFVNFIGAIAIAASTKLSPSVLSEVLWFGGLALVLCALVWLYIDLRPVKVFKNIPS